MDEVTPLLWLAAACVRTELDCGWDDTGLDNEALFAAGFDYYG